MPFLIWAVLLVILITTTSTTVANLIEPNIPGTSKQDGYYLDAVFTSETTTTIAPIEAANGPETFECPTENVITTRYKCNVNNHWVDCIRKHCCSGYIFIANKCIPKDQDPCEMNLCEQSCTVYLQRVICTCYNGYKFSPENQKKGITPVCVDINECIDKNGDCQHECINEIGSYRCACKSGYKLRPDNRSCEYLPSEDKKVTDSSSERDLEGIQEEAANVGHCYANCDTVQRLDEQVKNLQGKILALSTAVRMSSFVSGPPGPAGPPGRPGPTGPRGFPGPEGSKDSVSTPDDYTYSMLDAFVPLPGDEQQSSICRCKRGPIGPPGAPGADGRRGDQGERGTRGPKGDKASLDFILLLLADLRHDIMHLKNKVYINGEKPPQFDLKKHRIKERKRMKQNRLSEGFRTPAVEITAASSSNTDNGSKSFRNNNNNNSNAQVSNIEAIDSDQKGHQRKTKENEDNEDESYLYSEYEDSTYMDENYS